jgi:hypothetical protein
MYIQPKMDSARLLALLFLLLPILVGGCRTPREVNSDLARTMPPRFVWAWEREEDLRFLDPQRFGVAYLAQTLTLSGEGVDFRPRRQPLEIADGAYVIAVTRIETEKSRERRALLTEGQTRKLVELIKATLDFPNVRAIQIDFDVTVSERPFYRKLMNELRAEIPAGTPLTMTALASWCVGDPWFNDLPVDEAVPMAFVMGADDRAIRDFLAKGNDWREPLCRGSYGISVDEPIESPLKTGRRVFYFKNKSWQRSDLEKLRD